MPDRPSAKATVIVDNDRTRVTRWDFAPGAATGFHRHELDYVVVPLLDGELRLIDAAGETTSAALRAGAPYYRDRGVEHDVVNGNDHPYAFIEIELKP